MRIETSRLLIRSVTLSDCEVLVSWKNQELFRRMSIGIDAVITEENQKSDIQNSIDNNQPYYIVELKEIHKPVGYIRINWMDSDKKIAWLRFGMGEERRKGYCKEALLAVIAKYFQENVHRFDAEVYDYNEASLTLLKSIGFKNEGVRREAHISPGGYFVVRIMGLLQGDIISI